MSRLRRPPAALRALVASSLVLLACPASAQSPPAVGPFVADVRAALTTYPDTAATAEPRGLEATNLPESGLGVEVGAHFYPLRRRIVSVGVGATVLWSRGTRRAEASTDGSQPPAVTTKLAAFSPQVSLNFGTARGWSYLSGGLGTATLSISRDDLPEEEGQTALSINFGGGARWFFRERLGFTFDVRFYSISGQDPSAGSLGFPKTTQFVGSVGVAVK
jgi:hypothetical protein